MCRSIKDLRRLEPEATGQDVDEAALQFVRKVSGFRAPSKKNQVAFDKAVREVARTTHRLLEAVTANQG